MYYLDNDLPLDPEADFALRQAVDTAPPWRLTLPRHDDQGTITVADDRTYGGTGTLLINGSFDWNVAFQRQRQSGNQQPDTHQGCRVADRMISSRKLAAAAPSAKRRPIPSRRRPSCA